MKGILVTTEGKVEVKEYANPLWQAVTKDLGGYMEIVRSRELPPEIRMLVNDNGLSLGLPRNPCGSLFYRGGPIVGNVIFLKEGFTEEGPDFVDMTTDELLTLEAALNKLVDKLSRR